MAIIGPFRLRKAAGIKDCFEHNLRQLYRMRGWATIVAARNVALVILAIEVLAVPATRKRKPCVVMVVTERSPLRLTLGT